MHPVVLANKQSRFTVKCTTL